MQSQKAGPLPGQVRDTFVRTAKGGAGFAWADGVAPRFAAPRAALYYETAGG